MVAVKPENELRTDIHTDARSILILIRVAIVTEEDVVEKKMNRERGRDKKERTELILYIAFYLR